MKFTRLCRILTSGLLALILQCLFFNSFAQGRLNDFQAMKGTLFTHPITEKADSLSAHEIVELRDTAGIPIWFYRDILKNVCLTGECRMVRVRLYWNGAGNYLGLQTTDKEPLSKTDHSVFKPDDYQKLDRILSDSLSVLRGLKLKDLTVEKVDKTGSDRVDGHSAATVPSLQEYLVKNAAYTCYTLWHTVYGDTRHELFRILDQKADSTYLQHIFNQDNPEYLRWAVEFIRKNPACHSRFFLQIINQVKSKNEQLSLQALNYFTSDRLADPFLQKELARVFNGMSYQRKFEFLWKLTTVRNVEDDVLLTFLKLFEEKQINASLLGYTYKLIKADNLKNKEITQMLKAFTNHENLYVRNITQKLLQNQDK